MNDIDKLKDELQVATKEFVGWALQVGVGRIRTGSEPCFGGHVRKLHDAYKALLDLRPNAGEHIADAAMTHALKSAFLRSESPNPSRFVEHTDDVMQAAILNASERLQRQPSTGHKGRFILVNAIRNHPIAMREEAT